MCQRAAVDLIEYWVASDGCKGSAEESGDYGETLDGCEWPAE